MSWISTLLKGVGSFLGNNFGGLAQAGLGLANLNYQRQKDEHLTGAQQEANAFSAAEAQKARDWQEMMYTQYQSPQALMRQAQEAGINPAALYGQAFSGHTPSASSGPSSVSPQGGDTNGAIAQLIGLARSVAEIDNIRAQTGLFKSQETKTLQDVGIGKKQIEKMDAEIGNIAKNNELIDKQIEAFGADISLKNAQVSLTAMQETLASSQSAKFTQEMLYTTWRNNMIDKHGVDPEGLDVQWRFAMSVIESLIPNAKERFESFVGDFKLPNPFANRDNVPQTN